MKFMETMDRADERCCLRRRWLCAAGLAGTILLSLAASSFLYAVHVKSEASEKTRPGQTGKTEAFAEIDRGPRGKNEIALTFDGGAEADSSPFQNFCNENLLKFAPPRSAAIYS